MPARLRVVLILSVCGIVGCGPHYPNGVIKDRADAIEAWRQQCATDGTDKGGRPIATLRNDVWTVGYHDESKVMMAIFDAKSGKMKACYRGEGN
jgi:hypothetical protein